MNPAAAVACAWAVFLGLGVVCARPTAVRPLVPYIPTPILHQSQTTPSRPKQPGQHKANVVVVALVTGLTLGPAVGLTVCIASLIRLVLSKRSRRIAHQHQVRRELPEVVDLLRLAILAGGSVDHAIRDTAAVCGGTFGAALNHVGIKVAGGHRLTVALEGLVADTSPEAQPLARALLAADRHGVSIEQTLQRVGLEARESRRRHAQKRARQVPVKLLIPLVVCVLPAFALLTLVPTLVGTFHGLDLSPT